MLSIDIHIELPFVSFCLRGNESANSLILQLNLAAAVKTDILIPVERPVLQVTMAFYDDH
jgi:hypothetical protein